MITYGDLQRVQEQCISSFLTPEELIQWLAEQGLEPVGFSRFANEQGDDMVDFLGEGNYADEPASLIFAVMFALGVEFGMRLSRELGGVRN